MKSFHPNTVTEVIKLIEDFLKQGDPRYNNSESEKVLTDFILSGAVLVEERKIPAIETPNEIELIRHSVQGREKYIAKFLLQKEGFNSNEIFFERNFMGMRPDVFAENQNGKVIIECCSCKVSKVVEFLPSINELWILTSGEFPWEERPLFEKMHWIVFTKGPGWDKVYANFKSKLEEELKKIPSTIDSL